MLMLMITHSYYIAALGSMNVLINFSGTQELCFLRYIITQITNQRLLSLFEATDVSCYGASLGFRTNRGDKKDLTG